MFRLVSFEKKFNDINDELHYTPVINFETPKVLVDTFGAAIVEMGNGHRFFVSTNDGGNDCLLPIIVSNEEIEKFTNREPSPLDVLWSGVF